MRTEYFVEKRKRNERVCEREEREMKGEIDKWTRRFQKSAVCCMKK